MTNTSPTEKCSKQLRWECSSCSPNIKLETPRLHSGAACDRPETIEIPILPQIPEVLSQQPSETSTNKGNLNNTNIDSTKYCTQETSKTTAASQLSPPKGTQPLNYVVTTEHPPGNQTGNEPEPFLNCSDNCPTDIQNSEQPVTTTLTERNPTLTTKTPLSGEALLRDEQTHEVHRPLTFTLILK